MKSFRSTLDTSFSEELLLHSSCYVFVRSFSHFSFYVLLRSFSYTPRAMVLVRSFSYTSRSGFNEEFSFQS